MREYTIPDAVTEQVAVTVKAEDVRRGDGFEDGIVVDVKTGTKWVYLWVQLHTQTHKVSFEKGTDVSVGREQETAVSRKARERARKNQALAQMIAKRDVALAKALAKFNDDPGSHWYLDAVLEAQAQKKLWDEMAYIAGLEGYADKDLVDVREALVEELKKKMFGRYACRSLSRSTSVTSNLYEDVDREAAAVFIDGGMWFG